MLIGRHVSILSHVRRFTCPRVHFSMVSGFNFLRIHLFVVSGFICLRVHLSECSLDWGFSCPDFLFSVTFLEAGMMKIIPYI